VNVFEKITGMTIAEMQEYSWPSPGDIESFFWPPENMVDRDQIDRELEAAFARLLQE